MKKSINKRYLFLALSVSMLAVTLPYVVHEYHQYKIEKAYQHIDWAKDDAKELKIYDTNGREMGVHKK